MFAPAPTKATSASKGSRGKTLPWIEKYRPHTLNDIAHQEEVVAALRSSILSGNLPHLLFYGPPGTGKTSTILAAARELFGPDLYRQRIMELNASDERGIKIVRDKIKTFAQSAVASRSARVEGRGVPPFKLIILDEADCMTADAQAALRRTMETHSKVTRFCLICNYVSRIIEPLASRCAKFRFRPLSRPPMEARMLLIEQREGLQLSPAVRAALLDISGGDMRRAINVLQSATALYGGNITNSGGEDAEAQDGLTVDAVLETAGILPPQQLGELWSAIRAGSRGGFDGLQTAAEDVLAMGYPVSTVLSQLLEGVIIADSQLPDALKADISLAIAVADKRLVDGADEQLQFLDVVTTMQAAYSHRVLASA